MARWDLNPQERQNLRMLLGRLLIGPEYNPQRPLIDQILEKLRGGGSTEQKSPEELYPMPPDFAGGPEEWAKLSEAEKRYIHECLKAGMKVYISKPLEESRRATLDDLTLEKQRLKRVLNTEW